MDTTVKEGKQAGAAGSMAPTSASPSVSLPLTFTSPPPSLVLDFGIYPALGTEGAHARPPHHSIWGFQSRARHDSGPRQPRASGQPDRAAWTLPPPPLPPQLSSVLPIPIALSHFRNSPVRPCSIAATLSSSYTTSIIYTAATMSKQFDAAEIKEHKSGE